MSQFLYELASFTRWFVDLHSTYIIAGKSGLYLECIVVFELIDATDILSSNTKNSLKMLGDPSRGS